MRPARSRFANVVSCFQAKQLVKLFQRDQPVVEIQVRKQAPALQHGVKDRLRPPVEPLVLPRPIDALARHDRRRRCVANRRENPAPLRGAAIGLRDLAGRVPAAMRMEQRGFKLDVEAYARLTADLSEERVAAEEDYCEACQAGGHTTLINKAPSTPAQKQNLLEVLLSSEELQRWRRTEKSGALSTKRSELLRAGHYPPIMALVKLSRIDKVLSSFGQTLAVLASPITGRIHAHYRIANTASGRASCSGPNLQQVPRDRRFRALFVPEPGNVFIIADYASMELRAAAYISEDHAMTKAFEQGLDLHRLTASQMTGKDLADVTDEERKGAKCVNFGSVYGQGAGGLVQSAWDQWDVVLDPEEARHGCRRSRTLISVLRGGVASISGVRRAAVHRDRQASPRRDWSDLPPEPRSRGGSFYTRCCNLPVQGACADASMLALAYVDDRLFDAGIEGGPVAWLHDEIVLEVREIRPISRPRFLSRR